MPISGYLKNQVRTQLANYKEVRYGSSQIELLINANDLDKYLCLTLALETNEFVTKIMKRLFDGDVSGDHDFNNIAKLFDAFPVAARSFVETLSRSLDHPGAILLGRAIENFIDLLALMTTKKRLDFSMPRLAFSG